MFMFSFGGWEGGRKRSRNFRKQRKLRLQISLIQIYEENASTQRKVLNWGLMYHQKCSLHKSLSALKKCRNFISEK